MQKLTQSQREVFEILCQCKNFEPNPNFLEEDKGSDDHEE